MPVKAGSESTAGSRDTSNGERTAERRADAAHAPPCRTPGGEVAGAGPARPRLVAAALLALVQDSVRRFADLLRISGLSAHPRLLDDSPGAVPDRRGLPAAAASVAEGLGLDRNLVASAAAEQGRPRLIRRIRPDQRAGSSTSRRAAWGASRLLEWPTPGIVTRRQRNSAPSRAASRSAVRK